MILHLGYGCFLSTTSYSYLAFSVFPLYQDLCTFHGIIEINEACTAVRFRDHCGAGTLLLKAPKRPLTG